MKLPKNRQTLFVIMRVEKANPDNQTPIGIMAELEDADNYAGACEQDMIDHGITAYTFKVAAVSFYK